VLDHLLVVGGHHQKTPFQLRHLRDTEQGGAHAHVSKWLCFDLDDVVVGEELLRVDVVVGDLLAQLDFDFACAFLVDHEDILNEFLHLGVVFFALLEQGLEIGRRVFRRKLEQLHEAVVEVSNSARLENDGARGLGVVDDLVQVSLRQHSCVVHDVLLFRVFFNRRKSHDLQEEHRVRL